MAEFTIFSLTLWGKNYIKPAGTHNKETMSSRETIETNIGCPRDQPVSVADPELGTVFNQQDHRFFNYFYFYFGFERHYV